MRIPCGWGSSSIHASILGRRWVVRGSEFRRPTRESRNDCGLSSARRVARRRDSRGAGWRRDTSVCRERAIPTEGCGPMPASPEAGSSDRKNLFASIPGDGWGEREPSPSNWGPASALFPRLPADKSREPVPGAPPSHESPPPKGSPGRDSRAVHGAKPFRNNLASLRIPSLPPQPPSTWSRLDPSSEGKGLLPCLSPLSARAKAFNWGGGIGDRRGY